MRNYSFTSILEYIPKKYVGLSNQQLQKAIPDFEWRRGHSGTLLTEDQAQRLEKLFAEYLPTVIDRADGKNLDIL